MASIRLLKGAAGPNNWRSGQVLRVTKTSGPGTISEDEAKRYIEAGFAEPIKEVKTARKAVRKRTNVQKR